MLEEYLFVMICVIFVTFILTSAILYTRDGIKAKKEGRKRNTTIKTMYIISAALCILFAICAVAFVVLLTLAMYNM